MIRPSVVRGVVLVAVAAAFLGLAAPTADACKLCYEGLCFNAAADGYSSCEEVVILITYWPIYRCELSVSCQWDGTFCDPTCEPFHDV